MATYPGTEAAVLLAIAKVILDEGLYNEVFLRDWINWDVWLEADHPETERTFENFILKIREEYAEYTPEFAEQESGTDAQVIVDVARQVGRAGSRLSTINWRSASSGNLGGWQITRCLQFLNVLTGSIGTKGGSLPSSWNKYSPKMPNPCLLYTSPSPRDRG